MEQGYGLGSEVNKEQGNFMIVSGDRGEMCRGREEIYYLLLLFLENGKDTRYLPENH